MAKRKDTRSYRDHVRDLAARLAVDPSVPEDVRKSARAALRPAVQLDIDRLTVDERRAHLWLLGKAQGTPTVGDEMLSVQLVQIDPWEGADLDAMDVSQADLDAMPAVAEPERDDLDDVETGE